LPISQKSAPPAGQIIMFGIINNAEDGPANTAISPEMASITDSISFRFLEVIALQLYQKPGLRKKLMSWKEEAALRSPNGSPSRPKSISYRIRSATIIAREATISNS